MVATIAVDVTRTFMWPLRRLSRPSDASTAFVERVNPSPRNNSGRSRETSKIAIGCDAGDAFLGSFDLFDVLFSHPLRRPEREIWPPLEVHIDRGVHLGGH